MMITIDELDNLVPNYVEFKYTWSNNNEEILVISICMEDVYSDIVSNIKNNNLCNFKFKYIDENEDIRGDIDKIIGNAVLVILLFNIENYISKYQLIQIVKYIQGKDILSVCTTELKNFHDNTNFKFLHVLQKYVDTITIIPRRQIYQIKNNNDIFYKNNVSYLFLSVIRLFYNLTFSDGFVGVDFVDIRDELKNFRISLIGVGIDLEKAVKDAVSCFSISKSEFIKVKIAFYSIEYSHDIEFYESPMIFRYIYDRIMEEDAVILFQISERKNMKNEIRVIFLAGGYDIDNFKK